MERTWNNLALEGVYGLKVYCLRLIYQRRIYENFEDERILVYIVSCSKTVSRGQRFAQGELLGKGHAG